MQYQDEPDLKFNQDDRNTSLRKSHLDVEEQKPSLLE